MMTEEQAIAQEILDHMQGYILQFENDIKGCSPKHLEKIMKKVTKGEVTGAKAHRYIGWAQGVLCMEGYLFLNDARDMNRQAIEKVSNA